MPLIYVRQRLVLFSSFPIDLSNEFNRFTIFLFEKQMLPITAMPMSFIDVDQIINWVFEGMKKKNENLTTTEEKYGWKP